MAQPRTSTLMRPDVISFNSSISACEKASAWRKALRLLDDLDDIRRLSMTWQQGHFGPHWMEKNGESRYLLENTPQRQVWSPRGVTWFPMISYDFLWFPSKPSSTWLDFSTDFNHGLLNLGMTLGNLQCDEVEAAWWQCVSAGLQSTHGVTVDRRNGWGYVTYGRHI